MALIFAVFEHAAAATAAEANLASSFGRLGQTTIGRYTRAPLDANALPEHATEFGRNIAIAMIAGAVFMSAVGGIAGALDLMLGMSVAMGIGLGFVTGLLMGLVGAMQAGTRVPKPALRRLTTQLDGNRVLLMIEVDAARVDAVHERLEQLGVVALEQL